MKRKITILIFLLTINYTYGQVNTNLLEVEGNQLSFNLKSNADSVFLFTSVFGFEKFDKTEGVFQKSHELDSLEYSLITYAVMEYREGNQEILVRNTYYGSHFAKSPKTVEKITGRVFQHHIKSKILQEDRVISVYEPPEYNAEKTYGVVYFMDGEIVKSYVPIVEKLIRNSKIEDVILIGVHNRSDKIKDSLSIKYGNIDYRALEYLENYIETIEGTQAQGHYNHNHSNKIPEVLKNRHGEFVLFLKDEVVSWVNSNYKISKSYYKRALYGYSNGGAFVVSSSRKEPDLFGSYIALSFGWPDNIKQPNWEGKNKPKFYIAAGQYERSYLNQVKSWEKILQDEESDYVFTIHKAGHDSEMWRIEFAKAIQMIFNKTEK